MRFEPFRIYTRSRGASSFFVVVVASSVLFLASAAASWSQVSQQQSNLKLPRRVHPHGSSAVLVRSDADCTLTIDDGRPHSLRAGKVARFFVGVGEHLFQASTPSADYWDNVVTVPAGSQIIVRIPLLEQADLLADILQKKQEAEVDKAERAQLVEDKKSIEDGISALTGQHNDNMTSAQKDTAGGQTTIGIGQTLVNSGNDTAVLMGAFVYATGFIWQLKANGDVNAAKRNEDQIQYLRDQERQLADSEGPPSTSSPVKSAQDFHDLYVSVGPLSEF